MDSKNIKLAYYALTFIGASFVCLIGCILSLAIKDIDTAYFLGHFFGDMAVVTFLFAFGFGVAIIINNIIYHFKHSDKL